MQIRLRATVAALAFAVCLSAHLAWAQFNSSATTTTALTVTNSSGQALPARQRPYLAIINESASATIACNLGGTATVNGAGSITISPGGSYTWDAGKIPADQVNCISSAASSPATALE